MLPLRERIRWNKSPLIARPVASKPAELSKESRAPRDVLYTIALHSPYETIEKYCQTSYFRSVCEDKSLWIDKIKLEYPRIDVSIIDTSNFQVVEARYLDEYIEDLSNELRELESVEYKRLQEDKRLTDKYLDEIKRKLVELQRTQYRSQEEPSTRFYDELDALSKEARSTGDAANNIQRRLNDEDFSYNLVISDLMNRINKLKRKRDMLVAA